jgi:uncharacterized membrane protein
MGDVEASAHAGGSVVGQDGGYETAALATTRALDDDRTPSGLAAFEETIRRWLPHLPILCLVSAYTFYFTRLSLDVHRGLGTSGYDFALYDQGVWLMSRFKAPFVTVMGRNLMGDHTSFILIFLVPLYWIAPGAWVLMFSQAAAIGAGALPIYAIARRMQLSTTTATLLGAMYLLHPAVSWTNTEQFHPDAFLGVLIGLAFYAAISKKWRLFIVVAILALLVKEDSVLIIAPLGLWVLWRFRQRAGLWVAIASVFYALFATNVVMRSLIGKPTLNSWRIPFGGPLGSVRTTIHEPGKVFDYLKADRRPYYMWQVLLPYVPVWMFGWDAALVGVVVLVSNVVSTFVYQHLINYHYSLILVPPLAVGTVLGLTRFRGRRRRQVLTVVFVICLWTSHLWAVLPISRNVYAHWGANHPVATEVRELSKRIPPNAVVSATHNFVPHIDRRERIYQFPTPFVAKLWGTYDREGKTLPFYDDVEYVFITNDLADLQPIWDKYSVRYEPWVKGQYATIWVRKDIARNSPNPPGASRP